MKKPFGLLPLEEQLARRQAEQHARKVEGGKYFDHPTAKYIFIAMLVVTVVVHFGAFIVLGVLDLH
ncbi:MULTISPECIES: hypothetical protein [Thermomonospora]|uniref:Uncharacterized protein n=1 Tax=Thermomonospora cellulosilytica TaxID=1411118 RepID=A0A7W3N5P0_9ACTN|nr:MULTISPECIES: hypothetical protein [Thermomonospora]MBA9008036.1 hypothetical protein [Thermomonospora cellulosilytica]